MDFKTIFASIGLVFVVLYTFWYIMNKVKTNQDNVTTNNVPTNYMQQVGLNCPDYYINTSNENNVNTCKNSYHLEQSINSEDGKSTNPNCSNVQCYADLDNKTVNFDVINNWEDLNDNQRKSVMTNNSNGTLSRCDWINCCGSKVGDTYTKYPWVELQNYC